MQDEGDFTEVERAETTAGKAKAKRKFFVAVHRHKVGRKLYYENTRGQQVDTERAEWVGVSDGYELETRRHTYFTTGFPK